jgi:uncharacterized protein
VTYLLDVNVLIALGISQHQFHVRVSQWANSHADSGLLTCSITEIGFLRIVGRAPIYAVDVAQAKALLTSLKASVPLRCIADANDIGFLPAWVNRPGQITDGHLAQLAARHSAVLATLDGGIPDAYLIPVA